MQRVTRLTSLLMARAIGHSLQLADNSQKELVQSDEEDRSGNRCELSAAASLSADQ